MARIRFPELRVKRVQARDLEYTEGSSLFSACAIPRHVNRVVVSFRSHARDRQHIFSCCVPWVRLSISGDHRSGHRPPLSGWIAFASRCDCPCSSKDHGTGVLIHARLDFCGATLGGFRAFSILTTLLIAFLQPSPPPFPGTLSALHSNASPYPLAASASLPVLAHQEPHPLSNRADATALPRSASLPGSLKMCGCTCHQGASSIEETATVPGGLMHPSLIQPAPAVKVTVDSTSLHLRAPRMSTPASPQTNHHNANPATAGSATSSPSATISPLISITNALNMPSVSDVAEEVAPAGVRIRKTGLKRTHACDQCPQCE